MTERTNRWPHMGQMFVEKGRLSSMELESALAHQKQTGQPLGEILIEREHISRVDLAAALSRQWTWRTADSEAERETAALEQLEPAEPQQSAVVADPTSRAVVADPTSRAVVADLKAQLSTTHEQLATAETRLATLEQDVSDLTTAFGVLQKYLHAKTQEIEAMRTAAPTPGADESPPNSLVA